MPCNSDGYPSEREMQRERNSRRYGIESTNEAMLRGFLCAMCAKFGTPGEIRALNLWYNDHLEEDRIMKEAKEAARREEEIKKKVKKYERELRGKK